MTDKTTSTVPFFSTFGTRSKPRISSRLYTASVESTQTKSLKGRGSTARTPEASRKVGRIRAKRSEIFAVNYVKFSAP